MKFVLPGSSILLAGGVLILLVVLYLTIGESIMSQTREMMEGIGQHNQDLREVGDFFDKQKQK